MSRPVLHDYHRSSASYRVRIALNLKAIDHELRPVNLLEGDQKKPEYRRSNPQGLVPMLEIDGHRLTQSLGIIHYLEATRPLVPLCPSDPADRAHVQALALIVACDIHPLNNLRVLKRLSSMEIDQAARDDWYRHWIIEGFTALEALAAPRSGRFLFGDRPGLADICLVPQMFNARRFDVPVESFANLVRCDREAAALEPFMAAHPDRVAQVGMTG